MQLSKQDIARLIPHSGPMCLLDSVVQWDESRVRCSTSTHRDLRNPMRAGGQLPTVCGIEYAAQAMAVHGSLAGNVGSRPRSGYLASVRNVEIGCDRLDDLPQELLVDAEKILGDDNQVIYQFTLRAGSREILSGRATVVLDADVAAAGAT